MSAGVAENAPPTPPSHALQEDDAPQHLAPLHLMEGLLDSLQSDSFCDEPIERQATLEEQVNEQREISARQTIAVPGGL